jgi:nucleolin
MGSKGTKKRKVLDDEGNAQEETIVAKETVAEEEDPESAVGDQEDQHNAVPTTKKKRLRKRKRKVTGAETEGNDNGDETSNNQDNSTPSNDATVVVANDREKSAQVNRTLYIEGIPFAAQPDQVRQCILEHATFLDPTTDIVELRLPTWQDSGRLRGYGHVVLKSAELCTKVLSLFGSDGAQKMHLQKRYLTLQPAQAPKTTTVSLPTNADPNSSIGTEPSATVLLHNLAYAATEEVIEAAVSEYGAIVAPGGVRVVRHSGTGVSKGFGYVTFCQLSSAVALVTACSAQEKPLCILNRPCRVDYDHGRIRGSFRTADRKLYHQQSKTTEK